MQPLLSCGDECTLARPIPTFRSSISGRRIHFPGQSPPFLSHLFLQKLLTQVSLIKKSHLCQGNLNFGAPPLVNGIKNRSTDPVVWNDADKTTVCLLRPQLLLPASDYPAGGTEHLHETDRVVKLDLEASPRPFFQFAFKCVHPPTQTRGNPVQPGRDRGVGIRLPWGSALWPVGSDASLPSHSVQSTHRRSHIRCQHNKLLLNSHHVALRLKPLMYVKR